MSEGVLGTVYELCKTQMETLEPLDEATQKSELVNIGGWFSSNLCSRYYMLLNNELHDYTIFNFTNFNFTTGVKELSEVLQSRGDIISIDFNHDNNYFEIWMKNNGQLFMYLLFPCDDFVIDIR
jgi:hypothetical protein